MSVNLRVGGIPTPPKALIFDVFGTCTDWRSSVARSVESHLPGANALAFATAWRAEYQPAMARIREGDRGYIPLDDLHMENLQRVADRFDLRPEDPAALNRAWEQLDPWPDVPGGLLRLKKHAIIAPCSNGSIALMTRLARHATLPWDCILGAEIAQDYKPKAKVYTASVQALRLDPAQVMMVAAHNDDLHVARAAGLLTAFVPRPTEHGPDQITDLEPTGPWDVVAADFNDLAVRLFD